MSGKNNGHGGRRPGAGRRKGSRMRRSDALAEKLVESGKCPVDALVRLAEQAEAAGEIGQAIGAWKSILPYIYPKPKAIEIAPNDVVALARDLATARSEAARQDEQIPFCDLVERFVRKDEFRDAAS